MSPTNGLFGSDDDAKEKAPKKARAPRTPKATTVDAVPPTAEHVDLSHRLPAHVRLGTSSWSFPGWEGLVYANKASEKLLSNDGLRAYSRHPLLRTVGIDRTHYAPIPSAQFAQYAEQVPDDFRFLVKAHEACTLFQWPTHPRYGQRKGQQNELFCDAAYAARAVVEPAVRGLGDKLQCLLFQIAPQPLKPIGGADAFVAKLHAFLSALPKGPCYAIELRNRELLTPDYAAALADTHAIHCHTVLRRMPPLVEQWSKSGSANAAPGAPLLIRWMLHRDHDYESALEHYEPFHELVDEDATTRDQIALLAVEAAAAERPVTVIVNNKAEGSAPLSVFKLAGRIADELRH